VLALDHRSYGGWRRLDRALLKSEPSDVQGTALIRSSRTASRSYSWPLDVDRADPIDRARIKSWAVDALMDG
jgi:hypothetical protein